MAAEYNDSLSVQHRRSQEFFLVGWEGAYPLPKPHRPRRLRRLDPRTFGARLSATSPLVF